MISNVYDYSKTRALRNYCRGRFDDRAQSMHDILVDNGVSKPKAMGYAMAAYNGILNGSFMPGTPSRAKMNVSSGYDWLLDNPENLMTSYNSMKSSTLNAWVDAVAIYG